MKTLHTLLLLLMGIVLSGCASRTVPDNSAAPGAASDTQVIAVANKENIPNVELTDDIFFKVVSAEIAFQRGEFPAAFATTMAVAQQTHDPRLAKRAMEMALLAKQPLQALVAARLWHQYSPDSEEATQYYLSFMILNHNWDEVRANVAGRLAAASPKERGTILLQTQRLLMRGKDKQAGFALLEELCKPYADSVEAHLAVAQAAHANNDNERARTEAQIALQKDPSSQIAALVLAQASASPEAAMDVLAQFLTKNPTAHEVRRAYAGMLIEQKQFAEARIQLDKLASYKPDDTSILYALGVLELQLNDVTAAEKNLLKFVELMEVSPSVQRDPTPAYLYLSQIADDRKEGAAALDWLGRIQSYEGKNTAYFNAQLRRALLMAKYGSLEQAQQFLHELKTSPDEKIEVIQLEADLLRKAKRELDAINLLQEALTKYPDNSDLLYDFAMLAERLDRVADAESALRKLIVLTPENQQAYNALGYLLVDRNMRLSEARVLLEKALSLAPNDAFIIDSMGWLEFRENHPETALAFLQRAYQIRPDADIAVHIGEVLWTMGEQQKAKQFWAEAQQKDPENTSLKNTLKRLGVK